MRKFFSQNRVGVSDINVPQKRTRIIVILIAIGVVLAIIILAVILQPSPLQKKQQKVTAAVTAAAQKQTPNAKARDIKVADGFALATISDPGSSGQAASGDTTVFKVNKDGSMTQIASGSYLSPLYLLGLGISLPTQAKLTGQNTDNIEQTLANSCNYSSGDTPGYNGFDGTFNPDWQIDPSTLDSLEQKLDTVISAKNSTIGNDQKIICINATQADSSTTINPQTYISTFTLKTQFITKGGILSVHTVTFAVGPNYFRNYTLDGQEI